MTSSSGFAPAHPPSTPTPSSIDAATLALAVRYVALRPGLIAIGATGVPQLPSVEALVGHLAGNRRLADGAHLRSTIEVDLKHLLAELADDPELAALTSRLETALAEALAPRLGAEVLATLVAYYEGPAGTAQARLQRRMYAALAQDMVTVQQRIAERRDPRAPIAPFGEPEDERAVKALCSEFVAILVQLSDPGPGHDRSGLQALPVIVESTLALDRARYVGMWRELAEAQRKAIDEARREPVSLQEHEALAVAAGTLRAVVKPEALAARYVAGLEPLLRKWQALAR